MGLTTIPLTVAARNEARAIGPCLESLLRAARFAEQRQPLRFVLLVVLDRCTDGTAAVVARYSEVATAQVTGGKIEAQRRGLRPGPFNLFSDADIEVSEETLLELCQAMTRPEVQIAFPGKQPLPCRRATPLARALHAYNAARGYSSGRTWFSGKLFAIRAWDIPAPAACLARARSLPPSPFYAWTEGLRADDIYLSRRCLAEHGPAALVETGGLVRFRAPETWEGMYQYYRRLRRELERTDALFPETRAVHARFGTRHQDLLAAAPFGERRLHDLFRLALLACRARYRWERLRVETRARAAGDPWPAVAESKAL